MPGPLSLKIITPERVVLETEVDEVSARAVDGDFAILPDHQPMITALGIDVLKYKFKGEEHFAAVMGGLLEVGENKIVVLSDVAELDTEIDTARAHDDVKRLEAAESTKKDKLEVGMAEMAISKAMTRLKAAELGKRRRGSRMHGE